jgi:adenylylsulfate kinase-like enzyme
MIIIITGAPGSGKTVTAKYLFENTNNSAYIDGDWMRVVNPRERNGNNNDQRKLGYKNTACVVTNYHENGYTNIFIAFVYMQDEHLQEQVDLLKEIDTVKVFALVPNEETLGKRHREDLYKREGIESSLDLNKKIANLKNVKVIDNSILRIEEVAKIIGNATKTLNY